MASIRHYSYNHTKPITPYNKNINSDNLNNDLSADKVKIICPG